MSIVRASPSNGRHAASAGSAAHSTEAVALATRRDALVVASIVGCDVRTATRAIEQGVEAIRPRKLREELRATLMGLRKRVGAELRPAADGEAP